MRVEALKLVVKREGRGGGGGGGRGEEMINGLRNFKRFRKVQPLSEGIPQIVGLKYHVAKTKTLEEWLMEDVNPQVSL